MGTQVVYHGPFDEVEVPALGQVVKRGRPIEVDSDLAKEMLKQEDNWKRPTPSSTKKEGE
jgi:hypothetical protein